MKETKPQKRYVTYEQAQQLKHLGYSSDCPNVYYYDGNMVEFIPDYCGDSRNYNNSDVFGQHVFSAPSIDEAFRWLLDKFAIYVRVDYEDKDEWFYHICLYPGHGFEDYDGKLYSSYEDALTAGISSALQSLI